MSAVPPELCDECRCPLATDQRYCLGCGARVGAPGAELSALLERVGERSSTQEAPVVPPRASSLTLPPARISALLVLVFLGFGVLMGGAAATRVDATLASSRHVKLVLPAAAATASAGSASPASSPAGEAPPAQAEPTPAPAPPAEAPAATAPQSGPGKSTSSQSAPASEKPAATAAPKLPAIKHVFVLMLSDEPYAAVFGPASSAHYLSHTLERRGVLLVHYDAVAHEELASEIALISGQGPTAETEANCPTYADLAATGTAASEQVLGSGCVYPATTQTLAGQLSAKDLSWRAYVEGIDEGGDAQGACAHPAPGAPDPSTTEGTGAYATFRNPFVYFHSLIDTPACATNDVGLDKLAADLARARGAPSLSYIVPDRCHDGSPTPCSAGAPAGLAPADEFIERVVPQITASAAYKDGGLLVITVDEAPSSGEFADSSSCCGQPSFANVPAPAGGLGPRGGGAVGALLLSPFIKSASTSQEPYNHFSLLRTIEDVFALKHLGYAGLSGVKPFSPELFAGPTSG
jgi:phosphatidylinositol-3-phosphatase